MIEDNAPDANPEDQQPQQEVAPQPQAGGFPSEGEVDERSHTALNRMFAELRTETRAAKQLQEELRAKLAEVSQPSEPDIYDPQVRAVYQELKGLKSQLEQERLERAAADEQKRQAEQQGGELYEAYEGLMEQAKARNLPQVEPQRFFRTMERLGLQASDTGWEEACQMVYAHLVGNPFRGGQVVGVQRENPRSGPRAQVVTPVPMPGQPSPPSDLGPRRPDESLDDYRARLMRVYEEMKPSLMSFPEGVKVSSQRE